MTRKLLIIGAAVLLLIAASAGLYLKRDILLGRAEKPADAPAPPSAEDIAHAHEQNQSLKRKIREFGSAQDAAVYGDNDAANAQDRLFSEIASELDVIDFAKTPELPDMNAVLVYVLDGGAPDVLAKFSESATVPDVQKNFAKGVLALFTSERKEALKQLRAFEPLALSAEIAGPIALAKASAVINSADDEALENLSIARLLSPHTAIEESALRREILIRARRRETAKSNRLLYDYLMRYPKSAFAPDFLKELSDTLVANDETDGRKVIAELAETIEEAGSEQRAELALSLAQNYLKKGKLEAARAAVEMCPCDSATEISKTRARLYLAAADAPTERAEASERQLRDFSETRPSLSEEDTGIKEAALSVARGILSRERARAEPPKEAGKTAEAAPRASEATSVPPADAVNSTIARATALIKESEGLLPRETP